MIYFLTKAGAPAFYTIGQFVKYIAPSTRTFLTPVTYEDLFRQNTLKLGTYIFADLERLSTEELYAATIIYNRLSESGSGPRLLNNPSRVLYRYELLRTLHNHEINSFNAYRANLDCKPERFPVFIRCEDNHDGPESELIDDISGLTKTIQRMHAENIDMNNRIIIEYCARKNDDELYMTYGAFNIGGRIIPRHLLFSKHWVAKSFSHITDSAIELSRQYMTNNPHENQLKDIFSLANIDYGRIDYSIVDGSIQCYEINTNPTIANPVTNRDRRIGAKLDFLPKFINCLQEIDSNISGTISNEPVPGPQKGKRYPLSLIHRLKHGLKHTEQGQWLLSTFKKTAM